MLGYAGIKTGMASIEGVLSQAKREWNPRGDAGTRFLCARKRTAHRPSIHVRVPIMGG